MTPIIHTYYDPILQNQDELINIWKRSWEKQGWTAKVVSKSDIQLNPEIEKQIKFFYSLPSVNPIDYEVACYLRWIYMSQNGGWMSDYDVINCRFTPHKAGEFPSISVLQGHVPCLVYGSKEDYSKLVKLLEGEGSKYITTMPDGKKHVSDMFMFEGLIKDKNELIKPYNVATDFPTFGDVVHCSACHTSKAGMTKFQAMNFYE